MKKMILMFLFFIHQTQIHAAGAVAGGAAKVVGKGAVIGVKVAGKTTLAIGKVTVKAGGVAGKAGARASVSLAKIGASAGSSVAKTGATAGVSLAKTGAAAGASLAKTGAAASSQAAKAAINAEKILFKQIVQETTRSGKIITKVITKAFNGTPQQAASQLATLKNLQSLQGLATPAGVAAAAAMMSFFSSGDVDVKYAGTIENKNGIVSLIRSKLRKTGQSTDNSAPAMHDAITPETTTKNNTQDASKELLSEITRGRIDGEAWDEDTPTETTP